MWWLKERLLKAKKVVLKILLAKVGMFCYSCYNRFLRDYFDERELGEKCMNCGYRYLMVYRVPDSVWERVTGRTNGSGLLCPRCCDDIARKKGIWLFWEAAEGEFPTRVDNE